MATKDSPTNRFKNARECRYRTFSRISVRRINNTGAYLTIVAIVAGCVTSCAQDRLAAQEPAVRVQYSEFTVRQHEDAEGKQLPYRLLIPRNYRPTENYPLVIWLHGSGERGTDHQRQLSSPVANAFLAPQARAKYPCFVLVPQAPIGSSWSGRNLNEVGDDSIAVQMLFATVRELEQEFKIDDRRIYVGGFSMGAFGTWDLISRRPHFAAAAFPIGGTPEGWETICLRLKHIPIWIFHGDKDTSAPVKFARSVHAALREVDGNIRYMEYAGANHGETLKAFSEPAFFPWLFAQKLETPSSMEQASDLENSVRILRTMALETHGTWTGPVSSTRTRRAPRIEIDNFRYELHASSDVPDAIAKTIERIAAGTTTGEFVVTGTVFTNDQGRIAIDVKSLRQHVTK